MILFPQRLDKDIAGNDPVRVVDAVIDSLNLENFRKLYKERGRSPYHPNMMLKVVIYGYMNNLYSCRKIESALKRDIHFIWLAGYEQPDFNNFGSDKVKMDFAFFAIAFNLKKMSSTMTKLGINGGFCPKQKQITDIAIIFYVKKQRFEGNSQNLAA